MFIQLQKQSRSRSRDIQGRSASVSCTSHIPEPVRLRIVSCVWGCVGVCVSISAFGLWPRKRQCSAETAWSL